MAHGSRVAEAAIGVGIELTVAQAARLERYIELVYKWNRLSNLIGVATQDEFITRHIADCLAILPFVKGARVADIGSGAGLPGLVIACVRPDLRVDLVESRGKRARFLQQAQIELDLPQVSVVPQRVEVWQPSTIPDTIVSRALSSLRDFVTATHQLQRVGVRLIAMKGRISKQEVAEIDLPHLAVRAEQVNVPGWDSRVVVIGDVGSDANTREAT